jgi:hypothetical protein
MAAMAAPLPAVTPAMLDLVMPDAKVIVGADVDRVKNSPFGQFLLSQIQEDEREFQNLLSATGFDPRRDLREVLAASDSTGHSTNSLGVARGAFDETKLTALASVSGGLVTTYNGVKIVGPKAGTGDKQAWLAFLDAGVVVAGPADAVKAALDRRAAGQRLAPELAARIQSASSNYDAWMVTTVSPANLAGRVPSSTAGGAMQGNVIQAIEYVSGGFRFGSNVEIAGEAVTRSEKDATAVTDVVRFLASMAVSNTKPDSALSKMVESLQLTAEGNTVKFSITAPEEEIEKLVRPRRATTKKVVFRKM